MSFLTSAVAYARLGWHVIPIVPGEKVPLVRTGLDQGTTDEHVIEEWAGRWPSANIAIVTGPSGIFGVDVDVKRGAGGDATLAALEERHGALPSAPTVRTPSGGLHFYLSAKGLPAKFFDVGIYSRKLPGIDIRAGRSYLLAPPSILQIGDETTGEIQKVGYTWLRCPLGASLPAPPSWLVETLKKPKPKTRVAKFEGPAPAKLDALVTTVRGTPAGNRDNVLFWAARVAVEEAAAGHYTTAEAFGRLYDAGIAIGQRHDEVERALRDLQRVLRGAA